MHLTVTGGRMHKVSRSLLFASIVALGGLAACGDDVTVAPPTTGTGTVVVSPNPATVAVNGTVNMVADLGGAAVGQTVTWSSSNTAIATVDANGVVTGKAAGSVAIQAKTSGNFSGSSSLTVTAASTSQQALVSIASITQGSLQAPVQLNNVAGQIDVTLNVDPGQQNVERVELVMIDSVSGAEKVVASQTILAGASVASAAEGLSLSVAQAVAAIAAGAPQQIVLSFNTAAFDPATGAVSFINGRKLVRARLVLGTGSSQDQVASNTIAITLNNTDGFYIVQSPLNAIDGKPQPNSATDDVNGFVWFQAGKGIQARTVPVMYSGRTVKSRVITFGGGIASANRTINSGAISTDTIALVANAVTGINGARVEVVSAVATDGNPINLVAAGNARGAINGQAIGSNSNETIGVRLDSIRIDNAAPAVTFSIAATNPNNWVNAAYSFLQTGNFTAADAQVGLNGVRPWGAVFQYAGCGTAAYAAAATATGADIAECATDLTNSAYTGRVVVADKLGNTATSSAVTFGVDKTAPVITWLAPAQDSSVVRLAGDSVFHNTAQTYLNVTSANAKFGVRYTDERSGFDTTTAATVKPQARRITRLGPTGSTCALGGTACAFVTTLGPIEAAPMLGADARFRRDTVAIFGTLTAATPGYYTYETYVTDRAGNRSVTITKKAAIDITAPNITGITVPAILTGGQPATFTPTGTDDLEVIAGNLGIHYADPNLGGNGYIRWRRQIFPQYDAPWNTTLATPVGPGAPFGSAGLTIPGGFITRLETVASADSAPQAAYANTVRNADQVSAFLFDIKRYATWLAADSATAYAASTSSNLTAPIFVGNLANTADTTFFARPANDKKVHKIYVESYTNSVVKVTAVGPTVAVNPPFSRIEIVRLNTVTNEYDVVVGTLSAPVANDQGTNRFYTWTFTISTTGAGAGQAVFATGNIVRAIGVDANGNGLSTPDVTLAGVVAPTP